MPALSASQVAEILSAARRGAGGSPLARLSQATGVNPLAMLSSSDAVKSYPQPNGTGDVPVPSTPEELAAYESKRQMPSEKIPYALKNAFLSGGATDIRNMIMGASPPTAAPAEFAMGPALEYLRGGLTPSVASGTPLAQRGALSLAQKAEIAAQNANILQEAENLPIAARLMKEYNALPPGTPRAVKAKMERLIAEAIGSGVQPGWHPENFGVSQLLGHVSQGPNALSALAKGALSGIH